MNTHTNINGLSAKEMDEDDPTPIWMTMLALVFITWNGLKGAYVGFPPWIQENFGPTYSAGFIMIAVFPEWKVLSFFAAAIPFGISFLGFACLYGISRMDPRGDYFAMDTDYWAWNSVIFGIPTAILGIFAYLR